MIINNKKNKQIQKLKEVNNKIYLRQFKKMKKNIKNKVKYNILS